MGEKLQPKPKTFEGAMERLESIVHQMEAGELSLEELLERYEEGTKLVSLCGEKLSMAEKRIEIITRNAAGEPTVEEFDPTAQPPPPTASYPKPKASKASPSDDISLF